MKNYDSARSLAAVLFVLSYRKNLLIWKKLICEEEFGQIVLRVN